MAQYWFKPKCYGWGIGWIIAWQGWVALGLLIVLTGLMMYYVGFFDQISGPPSFRSMVAFFFGAIGLSLGFCFVFRDKVEGGLKWRWGKKDDS